MSCQQITSKKCLLQAILSVNDSNTGGGGGGGGTNLGYYPPGTNCTFRVPRGVVTTTPNWYPIPIPDDQFLEKRGTHPQISTRHQILDYHVLENRATPKRTTHKTKLIGNQYRRRKKTITDTKPTEFMTSHTCTHTPHAHTHCQA